MPKSLLFGALVLAAFVTLSSDKLHAYALIDFNTLEGSGNRVLAQEDPLLREGLLDATTSVDVDRSLEETEVPEASSTVRASALMSSETMPEGESLNVKNEDVRYRVSNSNEGRVDVKLSEVRTNADFQSYIESLMLSDESVEAVSFTGDEVTVQYEQKGRLLALFPITFSVEALANASGTVEVRYPWYSAVTVDSEEEVEARARVAVDNALKARAVGSVRAEGEVDNPQFTASEAAVVATELQAVLRATFESWGQAVEE